MCGVKIVIKTKTIGDTNYADYFRFKKLDIYIYPYKYGTVDTL